MSSIFFVYLLSLFWRRLCTEAQKNEVNFHTCRSGQPGRAEYPPTRHGPATEIWGAATGLGVLTPHSLSKTHVRPCTAQQPTQVVLLSKLFQHRVASRCPHSYHCGSSLLYLVPATALLSPQSQPSLHSSLVFSLQPEGALPNAKQAIPSAHALLVFHFRVKTRIFETGSRTLLDLPPCDFSDFASYSFHFHSWGTSFTSLPDFFFLSCQMCFHFQPFTIALPSSGTLPQMATGLPRLCWCI